MQIEQKKPLEINRNDGCEKSERYRSKEEEIGEIGGRESDVRPD